MRAVQIPPTIEQRFEAISQSPVVKALFVDEAQRDAVVRFIITEDTLTDYVDGASGYKPYKTRVIPTIEQRFNCLIQLESLQNMFDSQMQLEIAVKTILAEDPLTHYVRGLDSWQDYLQRQSKHWPTRGI